MVDINLAISEQQNEVVEAGVDEEAGATLPISTATSILKHVHLTSEQQHILNHDKNTLRVDNEKYLRQHPECHAIAAHIIDQLLKAPQPVADINAFIKSHLADPQLKQQITQGSNER